MINVLKSQFGSSVKSVRRFLERPINLQQGNLSLGAPASSRRADARDEQRLRMRRMKRDLYLLLEQHPTARQLMRHLDLVDQTLRRDGVRGIEALPVRVIAKALTQLERLVWDWSPVGLAELRSRMAVIVKSRPAEAARDDGGDGPNTDSLALRLALHPRDALDSLAEVSEVEHDLSAFAEMERSWAGRMPDAVAQALTAAKEPNPA